MTVLGKGLSSTDMQRFHSVSGTREGEGGGGMNETRPDTVDELKPT